jgi:hypothetical protein
MALLKWKSLDHWFSFEIISEIRIVGVLLKLMNNLKKNHFSFNTEDYPKI